MKCPGQDSRFWKPDAIFEASCPKCQAGVEFFKDDTARNCPHCGHRFVNPHMDFGCASYCQFAEQCLGSLPPEVAAQQQELLKEKVAMSVRRILGGDHARLRRLGRVADYAERIGKQLGADLGVAIMAAYLHKIGEPDAENRHSQGGTLQQREDSPSLARRILEALGTDGDMVQRVCDIVGRDAPRSDKVPEFEAVHDAQVIAYLQERGESGELSLESLSDFLQDGCLTNAGCSVGEQVLGLSRARIAS